MVNQAEKKLTMPAVLAAALRRWSFQSSFLQCLALPSSLFVAAAQTFSKAYVDNLQD